MILRIRNSKFFKASIFLLITQFTIQSLGLNHVFAGDGGPTQPEVQSFEPIGTNQMVDPFTGDFTYNIPLFNLPGPNGGYPVNLAYHSGIQMDQEASWVGLGWNINMGTITRQVRHLPDDFKEDPITIKTDYKNNWTVNLGFNKDFETFGFSVGNLLGSVNSSLGVELYYNNYKGLGYSLDFGSQLRLRKKVMRGIFTYAGPISGDLGFNVKLDSREGVSGSVSAGISGGYGDCPEDSPTRSTGISTGFTQSGWNKTLTIQASANKNPNNSNDIKNKGLVAGGSSHLSFAQPVVGISTQPAMRGGQGSFVFRAGPNVTGNFTNFSFNAGFEISKLKNKGKAVEYKGFGYDYYQYNQYNGGLPQTDNRIIDMSTENEGLVHKNTRRLAVPNQTYDNYLVTGQGIGASFRPHRTDIGFLSDANVHSEFHGGNVGVEVGAGSGVRLGIDLGYSFASTNSGQWPDDLYSMAPFGTSSDPGLMKSVYFQNYGEQAEDDLVYNYGGVVSSSNPVAYAINPDNNFYKIQPFDQAGNTIVTKQKRETRKKRGQGIEPFTNDLILQGSNCVIPEFDLGFYGSGTSTYNPGNLTNYTTQIRQNLPKHHVGGFINTTSDGLRYVYGIPAQNTLEKEVTKTVEESNTMVNSAMITSIPQEYKINGTNKAYNSTEKGTYSHSHLLTSILGNDYVDVDGIPGASDGDLGYWVKMNYVKAHADFQWKSPHKGANYNRGYKTNFKDGTINYSYGKKDVWYTATLETKTHVAEFILADRNDCKEPGSEMGGTNGGRSYKKLVRIDIYLKSERYLNGSFNGSAIPIKSCHFEYAGASEELCKNTPDADAGYGKLTLKKVWFTYRGNTTGQTNKYVFGYNSIVDYNNNGTVDTEDYNGNYNKFYVDRWGNYKPFTSIDDPYNDAYLDKAKADERAGLWNLSTIDLPSGGRIEVNYESDTYAYVQNEVAMNMFKIASLDPYDVSSSTPVNRIDCDKNQGYERRRVYFKLKKPLAQSLSSTARKAEMNKYIREGEYLYFKVNINLTKNQSTYETVGGYARVEDINVDETSLVGGDYLWGYVQLGTIKVDDKDTQYHPFTEVGARHIRYNQPEILVDNLPNADMDNLNKSAVKAAATSMLSMATNIRQIFNNYTERLYQSGGNNDRLSNIQLSNSFIRMRTPDKIKFGGGHRVHEVKIYDNWATSFISNGESSSSYSTVYDYDIVDENGNKYSSGVATYEPLVGGDENPLRNPVSGWEDKNAATKTVANTYSELPDNEANYPGPMVGYSQVRIMSGNTATKIENFNGPNPIQHYGGITVQKFYTAKDFPIISKVTELEQNKTFKKSNLIVPALIVNVSRLRMAASQGYYLELNDMHGKQKTVEEYKLIAENSEQLVSSVQYDYSATPKLTTNRAGETFTTYTLNNKVDVWKSDYANNDNLSLDAVTQLNADIGTELDFSQYVKYNTSKDISGGVHINFETIGIIPAFFPIPNFNWNESRTGIVVTNKIVSKSGVVKKVTAVQQGSKVETENLLFDDITGQPVLTTITNDFGDKIYNYNILGRDVYDRMGPAYKNIGLSAFATVVQSPTNGLQEFTLMNSADFDYFVKGDKLLCVPVTSSNDYDPSRPKVIAYYNDGNYNSVNITLEVNQALTGKYNLIVIQSGRKNLISTPVTSITSLTDPTKNRTEVNCTHRFPDNSAYKLATIDNVISINAVELGEFWYKDNRQLGVIPANWYDNQIYSKGFGGIYTPIRNYAYIDNRTQDALVNLKTNGIMNDVQMFNYDFTNVLGNESECASKWKKVDQITLQNPSSNVIETKNILGTYSSSLFGRSGTEPIAMAGNAKNTEIGFESFEEYTVSQVDIKDNSTNNLNFYSTNLNPPSFQKVENRYDVQGIGTIGKVVGPSSLITNGNMFMIRMFFDAYRVSNGGVVTYYPKAEKIVRLNVSDISNVNTINGVTSFSLSYASNINIPNWESRAWNGELFVGKDMVNPGPSSTGNAVAMITTKAHTGTTSLKIATVNGDVNAGFEQRRLNLLEGKEYQLSGWFSTANNAFLMQTYDEYFDGPFKLQFYDQNNNLLSSNTLTYSSKDILQGGFIDEWQKFTINFIMPSGASYVKVILPRAQEVYDNAIQDYVQYALYDDLRIQPRDGGMVTYVYNKYNQRLEAELDENNYATFYYYDDEGNLFLVKRETEKGIITVQESRATLKRN
jgi:hypothetical protein